jgi:hypothetical protein
MIVQKKNGYFRQGWIFFEEAQRYAEVLTSQTGKD